MQDMERAVLRILSAIENNERIIIYNDYDCDGIPAGVLLHDFFAKIGYEHFSNYIPHRYREGYGLNIAAIEQLAADGAKLMITADCGITDTKEVSRAQALGIDVIVTDHHLPVVDPETGVQRLPPAYAVIDNKRADDEYPFKDLCGAGTAFKLVQALIVRGRERFGWAITEGWEKWLLDMAGLATIADMVPLHGENRVIARYGLHVLRKSPRPGLQALCRAMRMDQQHVTEDDIGFMIAPRVNAASRMGEPMAAFNILKSKDPVESGILAGELETLNDRRKGLVAAMVKDARRSLVARPALLDSPLLVIGNPEWMPGLLGLAAQTLVGEYRRPTFVWGRYGAPHIKGSCRSDGSVNVVELMAAVVAGTFLDFGGHREAGGFSIAHEHIHTLEAALHEAHGQVEKGEAIGKTAELDAELSLEEVTFDIYSAIEALAPFGMGNPKPLFLFKKLTLARVELFGREKAHLKLLFADRHPERVSPVQAIGFFQKAGQFGVPVEAGGKINLVASLECSYYRAVPELRLRIVDIF
jgi:single-stranded-DNA-specific exonuclease